MRFVRLYFNNGEPFKFNHRSRKNLFSPGSPSSRSFPLPNPHPCSWPVGPVASLPRADPWPMHGENKTARELWLLDSVVARGYLIKVAEQLDQMAKLVEECTFSKSPLRAALGLFETDKQGKHVLFPASVLSVCFKITKLLRLVMHLTHSTLYLNWTVHSTWVFYFLFSREAFLCLCHTSKYAVSCTSVPSLGGLRRRLPGGTWWR